MIMAKKTDAPNSKKSAKKKAKKQQAEKAELNLELYNEQGIMIDDDERLKINFNIFVRYMLSRRKILIDNNKTLYWYKKQLNLWEKTDITEVCKFARKIMDKVKSDMWQSRFKFELKEILELTAERINEAKNDSNYINLKNGLFNLDKLELEPHTSDIFSTCQLPFEYDENAECQEFLGFIDKLTLKDKELKAVIQEIIGYALTRRVDAQKFFVFWSGGSSGKSTLCDVLLWLAGEENVSTVSLGALSDKFSRSQIEGKILNLATENEAKRVKTALLKQIVGGDVIQIERKGKDPLSYRPYVKCVFAVNNLPQFYENSYGMLRRMLIVPFPALFTDKPNPENKNEFQRIPNFQEKLKPELAGIFNFAMEGYKRLIENNFVFSKSKRIDEIMRLYIQRYNPVQEFIGECLIKAEDEDEKMYKKDLYEKFREWCRDNDLDNPFNNIRGFLTEAKKQFPHFGLPYDELNSNGKPYKSNGNAYILGVAFSEEYDNGEGLLNDD